MRGVKLVKSRSLVSLQSADCRLTASSEFGFLIANLSNAIVSLLRHRWAHSLRRSSFPCVTNPLGTILHEHT